MSNDTVLVKSFEHLNQDFPVAALEERGKLWQWLRVYSGVGPLQQRGHRKSMKSMCETFDQHCREGLIFFWYIVHYFMYCPLDYVKHFC